MFSAIASFLINLAVWALLFLVSIGDLASSQFFTTFHLLKVSLSQDGPQGGWLNTPYNVLTFGLWSFCEGRDDDIKACIDPKIGYTLDEIPFVNEADQHYVPNAARSFGKISVLFIPATCVAFLALVLSFVALFPRFRKRWLHAFTGFLLFLVTIVVLLLMIMVFTLQGYRKVQFGKHLNPPAMVTFGPAVWMVLALVPLTILGSVLSGFAVCCPGRYKKSKKEEEHHHHTKEVVEESHDSHEYHSSSGAVQKEEV
ncbi:MAG: SUR7/PalI family-domain-containing protein [Benniella sp.]|nr:MAG: SUR7/PalI family-domain-containing protein [Benniella sp.]